MLAVAPLFLCPFVGEQTIVTVYLWLSLQTGLWLVLEPSMRMDEHLNDARRRVAKAMFYDPLFWVMLVVVAFTALRAINTGIGLSYDAEAGKWFISSSVFPFLPGVVGAAGNLPFAASVAMLVLLQGCRHCLGRSARKFFLLASSSLSGLAAIVALIVAHEGGGQALELMSVAAANGHSTLGFGFGLYLAVGFASFVAAFDFHPSTACLAVFSIAGNLAGLFAFSPAYLSAGTLAVGLLVLLYAIAYTCVKFRPTDGFRILALAVLFVIAAGGLAFVLVPKEVMSQVLEPFVERELLPAQFFEMRGALSAIANKVWVSNIWIGTGLGSFPLDFRFNAQTGDLAMFPGGASSLAFGWWLLLVERGIAGGVVFALPFGFLLFTYFRRMAAGLLRKEMPHPECLVALVLLATFVGAGFIDCSPLRVEVVLAAGAFLAVSAAAFPAAKRG